VRISDSETIAKALLVCLLSHWGFETVGGKKIPLLTERGNLSDRTIEAILNMGALDEGILGQKIKGENQAKVIINGFQRLKVILRDILYLKAGYSKKGKGINAEREYCPVSERIGINEHIYNMDLNTIHEHQHIAAAFLYFENGNTQKEIAKKMGVNQATVSRWLR